MPRPLLSIVTPSLDQGRYIGQCLESVAREMATPEAQELGVEHIVLDGGSRDDTVDLLERASHLAYWQSAPDRGQSHAVNTGLLEHASGRYATWLNADDWYEPGALGPVLGRLSQPEPPDVLVGRCRFVEDGKTVFRPRPPEPIDMASLLCLRSKWFAGKLIVQPEAFFDRAMFERVGGLNEANHYTMDHELWLRLLETGARFEAIDHPVACMRVHEAQKTANNARIVRSLVEYGKPFLERHHAIVGGQAAAEIEAIERKLALSEPVLRRLKAPWGERPEADRAEAIDCQSPPGFHIAPLRAVLAGVPRRPGFLRRYALRPFGPLPPDLPLQCKASASGPCDAVLFWTALSTSDDPRELLRRALADLRSGGLVIAAAELNACDLEFRKYTRTLAAGVDRQLSQDHDWLVDPAAMPWVNSLADTTDADDARWLAAYPHPVGIDLCSLLEAEGLTRLDTIAYGGMSWHPLTPFPALEAAPSAHAWRCGVWTKR